MTEGKWEEVEDYLKGFTKSDENDQSVITFFDIRKTKYLEALDKYAFCDSVLAFFVLVGDSMMPLCVCMA